MAEREGPQANMPVFLIKQALKEARNEALRRGVVVDVERESTLSTGKNETAVSWKVIEREASGGLSLQRGRMGRKLPFLSCSPETEQL